MLFEELYNKLIDNETYLKREEGKKRSTNTSHFNRTSKGKGNESNKNFNKRQNKISPRHMCNTLSHELHY